MHVAPWRLCPVDMTQAVVYQWSDDRGPRCEGVPDAVKVVALAEIGS
jgi:hypothetical protein